MMCPSAAQSPAVTLLKTAFWASAGLLVYTHAGYPAALAAVDRIRGRHGEGAPAWPVPDSELPGVTVIVELVVEPLGCAEPWYPRIVVAGNPGGSTCSADCTTDRV